MIDQNEDAMATATEGTATDGSVADPGARLRQSAYVPPNMHPSRIGDLLAVAAKDAAGIATRLSKAEPVDMEVLKADLALLARSLETACRCGVALSTAVQKAQRDADSARSAARRGGW